MVHGVAGSAVDDRAVRDVFSIVNEDSPEIDESKEDHIGKLLERENEWEYVVRHTLRPTIEWMKSVRCERGGHNPFMMWFVQGSVDQRMMQTAMNPVDEEVGEQDEKWKLNKVVKRERSISGIVVQLSITPDLGQEERNSKDGHHR